MSEIKSKDFKHNERVELSGYFEVHAHGNGFQLKREDRTYSIIPIEKKHDMLGVKEIGWEVNSDKNRFNELHEAIEYVLDEEDISVTVENIREYYGMKEEAEE